MDEPPPLPPVRRRARPISTAHCVVEHARPSRHYVERCMRTNNNSSGDVLVCGNAAIEPIGAESPSPSRRTTEETERYVKAGFSNRNCSSVARVCIPAMGECMESQGSIVNSRCDETCLATCSPYRTRRVSASRTPCEGMCLATCLPCRTRRVNTCWMHSTHCDVT
jgi:hypothetical protein